MTAQHESHGAFVPQIPKTINAIGAALTGVKRARFYGEVLAAEQGDELDGVMSRWWKDAMLDLAPGRERRRENAVAGKNMVPLPSRRIESSE